MSNRFDVVIVGAGPAGSSAAFYLAHAGVKVLLLDKADFPRDKTCGDGLVPRALPILAEMGVVDAVTSRGCKLDHLQVSAPSGRSVHFDIPRLPHAPNHALVIPRLELDNLLLQRAIESGVDFRGGVHVRALQTESDGVTVYANESYRAALVIVATGANTALLSSIGMNPPKPNIVAARAYFEGIEALPPYFQFRFDGVVLPGYGWVFPLSASSANIGAGFIRTGKREHHQSAQTAFNSFIHSPVLKSMLGGATQVGSLRSFPIRTDFASAPTFTERTLLVGEAAGLVNPLTGDGIDFALESGKIAAEHVLHMLRLGDISRSQLQAYDTILRQRYQNLFRFSQRVSHMALNRRALDWLVPLAAARPKLPEALVNILLGAKPAPEHLSFLRIVKGVAARL
ncbi:MAG: geranylgeranyl reductase family protein [Anaerolineaceae bacterium]|nr:geranylgeranyl reductase family protein [Anaerolineaceae bacterium]